MKRILILILGISVFAALSHASNTLEPSINAWWLDITFKPTQRTIHGIPLEKFNQEWAYAERLSSIDLSRQISTEDIKEFKSSRFSFEKRVDLNRNGKQEQLIVGVYQLQNGVQGRFVAIFEQNKLLKTLTEEGAAGFSALLIDKGKVYWSFCMQCGGHHSRRVMWNGDDYVLW